MTDNLRDRIAAVITSGRMDRSNYELADAVIEALDLAKPCVTAGCRIRRITRERFKYGERYGI